MSSHKKRGSLDRERSVKFGPGSATEVKSSDGDDGMVRIVRTSSMDSHHNPFRMPSEISAGNETDFQIKPKPKWYDRFTFTKIFDTVSKQLQKWTAFPMLPAPNIYFEEDEKYDASGERIHEEDAKRTESGIGIGKEKFPGLANANVELKVNYERSTEPLLEAILKFRKEAKTAKDSFNDQGAKVNLAKFPEWNEAIVDRMRGTFRIFDISGDGLVDFEELTSILAEFGDTSPPETRMKFFDEVDNHTGSVDFGQFLALLYNITVRRRNDPDPHVQGLANSFHAMDRNMARIRSLDVVQQLQAGIF